MQLFADARPPFLFLFVGYSVITIVSGLALSLLMDVFAPDWDISIRAKYPQFTTGNRFIAGGLMLVAIVSLVLPPMAMPLRGLIVLGAAASPFIWFVALIRRKK